MILIDNISIWDFNAWSGAVDTKEKIIDENKADDFDALIDELYPNGLTTTQLNDILWFDADWIYEQLGISNK